MSRVGNCCRFMFGEKMDFTRHLIAFPIKTNSYGMSKGWHKGCCKNKSGKPHVPQSQMHAQVAG